MRFEKNIAKITRTVTEFVQPKQIILFGSRTHGTAHRYSDYDIALVGVDMDHRTERRLKQALDDRLGIFIVDLINMDKIDMTLLKKGCLTAEHAETAEIFNFRIDFPKIFIKKQMTPLKKGCLTAEHAETAEIFNFQIDFPKIFIEKHKFV